VIYFLISNKGYFEIDGAVYYFYEEGDFYPDEAQAACEALGMTLIRFENIEKWYSILAWADQGIIIYNLLLFFVNKTTI